MHNACSANLYSEPVMFAFLICSDTILFCFTWVSSLLLSEALSTPKIYKIFSFSIKIIIQFLKKLSLTKLAKQL